MSADPEAAAASFAASFTATLVVKAAAPYARAGRFAFHFARGKLAGDSLFATLLRTGAIPDAACLVDLGCGQGLLAAWLQAAREAATGDGAAWPAGWPAPPRVSTYLGIDRSRADVARARRALPSFARVFRGDLRSLAGSLHDRVLDRCDVATLLDVLQYLDPAAQERLLVAIHAGLPPWGVLVLRVGDGASGRASLRANAVDLLVSALRGHPHRKLHRRPLAEWVALLERLGFAVEVLDDDRGTTGGFANVLLRASRSESVRQSNSPSGAAAPLR